ncbi:MAG: hypothetical protein Q9211_001449 [Gyalolechia sp. 1 TL-2023]
MEVTSIVSRGRARRLSKSNPARALFGQYNSASKNKVLQSPAIHSLPRGTPTRQEDTGPRPLYCSKQTASICATSSKSPIDAIIRSAGGSRIATLLATIPYTLVLGSRF